MARLKLQRLQSYLQDVEGFSEPKLELEQYETTPHLAAMMLHTIESCFGGIDGCVVADLGCGSGRLLVGAGLLGARLAVGVDVDVDALEICRQNVAQFELGPSTDLVRMDVTDDVTDDVSGDVTHADAWQRWAGRFDCVVMNPPFGTKNNKGIDMQFVRRGLQLTNHSVYSLHKTSTRPHVLKVAADWGVTPHVFAELRFDLPATFAFHRLDSRDIAVDLVRFTHPSGTAEGGTDTGGSGGVEGMVRQLKDLKMSRKSSGAREGGKPRIGKTKMKRK